MISIKCPKTYQHERKYVCKILLADFLGLDYKLQFSERKKWQIQGGNDETLILPDILFQTPNDKWLAPQSLPMQPLQVWKPQKRNLECMLVKNRIPVIYGDHDILPVYVQQVYKNKDHILPIDIFGSSFFMLTRYEEMVKNDRDEHDRFPATASLAYQEGFLDRPIVNEYLEILWDCMKYLWPGLKRKQRAFQMRVSCDVDHPYQESVKNVFQQVKHIGSDLVTRRSPRMAVKSTLNYIATRIGNLSFDVNFTSIDWIMDVNEGVGNKVAFYFKAGQTDDVFDSGYSLEEPIVRQLFYNIYRRGHEIGLHPSYHTYRDKRQLCREADNLRYTLNDMGINKNILGGRQHYLRWETPTTAINWEAAGLDYDSTLSYADHAGFRCGVCYEYPLFDITTRKILRVTERPLIAMECSVIDAQYMNLTTQEAVKYMLKLKYICRKYFGDFTLLWHNSILTEPQMKKTYLELLND